MVDNQCRDIISKSNPDILMFACKVWAAYKKFLCCLANAYANTETFSASWLILPVILNTCFPIELISDACSRLECSVCLGLWVCVCGGGDVSYLFLYLFPRVAMTWWFKLMTQGQKQRSKYNQITRSHNVTSSWHQGPYSPERPPLITDPLLEVLRDHGGATSQQQISAGCFHNLNEKISNTGNKTVIARLLNLNGLPVVSLQVRNEVRALFWRPAGSLFTTKHICLYNLFIYTGLPAVFKWAYIMKIVM